MNPALQAPAAPERRKRRHPTWEQQLATTVSHIVTAIEAGDTRTALAMIDYADSEWVGSNYHFYTDWHAAAAQFLRKRGMPDADIQGAQDDLLLLVNTQWAPGVPYYREAELRHYRAAKARLIRELNAPAAVALATLQVWHEIWRSIHDRDVDFASGLMNVARQRWGEACLEELIRDSITARFDARYARYDISHFSWDEAFDDLVHASIEIQRGHLAGPQRDGELELEQFDDRVSISFAPCGTGGRTIAGDQLSDTPSRDKGPYWFHIIEGEHDFAWNKKGVCQYCSHCAMMTGKLPIERFGYPLRVVEPPVAGDPQGRCRWTIYRDPRDVPASYYASLGERKPEPHEPLGSLGRQAGKETA